MRLFGFLLLVAGWAIVVTAIALLAYDAPRVAFVLSGVGVEIVGLVIVIRAHRVQQRAREGDRG
jgi:FtsH-binding integral membrane protein